ncbi:MAG: caspase family protein [Bryobacteraceae bacterium]|jgi:hypothetical protein
MEIPVKRMLRSGLGLLCGILLAQPSALRSDKKVALVIGNNLYQHVTPLRTATNDARSVQAVLQQRYGFETTLLLNATRSQIVSALNSYRRDLGADSSLLIYYAGHGFYDRTVDKAYWWPVDAKDNDNTDWISADDITTNIKGIASRHVLIVSDSCFSGTLTRGVNITQNLNGLNSDRARTLHRLEQRPSRELIASGGNEPVADSGAGQHSVFAGAFLRALESMQPSQFAAEELFQEVRTSVAGNSAQVPQFDPLRNSGDDGGSFVFSRTGEAAPITGHAPGRPWPSALMRSGLDPAIVQVIETWVETTKNGDLEGKMALYGNRLDVFYTKPNLSKANVEKEIRAMISSYSSFPIMELSNVTWNGLREGVVQVEFDKDYTANKRTGGSVTGRVHSQLTLVRTGKSWSITGERDPKIYWTH